MIRYKSIWIDEYQGINRSGNAFGFIGGDFGTDYCGLFFDYPTNWPVVESEDDINEIMESLNYDSTSLRYDSIPITWARKKLRKLLNEKINHS